jgi:hypothetical protein
VELLNGNKGACGASLRALALLQGVYPLGAPSRV